MLAISDLIVSCGRTTAVSSVSIDVAKGTSVCVVGPNGAGKSSLMLAVAGALKFSGDVRIDGRSVRGMAPEDICWLGLAMVPEGRGIFPFLSVQENLMLGSRVRRGQRTIDIGPEDIYARFPVLKERRHSPAGKLSGGEQQQLSISRALMTSPKLLLIDEPSLGLAPLMVAKVYEFLGELKAEGMTMLIVEQNLNRALSFSDQIHVLRQGRVRASGATSALRDSKSFLEEAYFGFGSDQETAEGAGAR